MQSVRVSDVAGFSLFFSEIILVFFIFSLLEVQMTSKLRPNHQNVQKKKKKKKQ